MARLYAFAEVDKRRAEAKLKRLEKEIKAGALKSVDKLVELGVNYAKQTAPFSTGQTYHSISGKHSPTETGASGLVYIKLKDRYDDKSGLTTVDVVKMLARGKVNGRYIPSGHIRTGQRYFMRNTKQYLQKIAKWTVTGNFKQIKI